MPQEKKEVKYEEKASYGNDAKRTGSFISNCSLIRGAVFSSGSPNLFLYAR